MPKSKKKKNADFQKVKLKVGKRPKGGNETVISFKSRTIKITQNLKDLTQSSSQAQTKRKLTLQELLKQCGPNKSCSQRLNTVEGFKELLLSDAGKQTVLSRLHEVMIKVSDLLSDPEPTVRQAVLRLCKTVFALVDSDKISFFDYMSAHLCCAMKHISDSIRHDALTLFDMLLEKCPAKVVDEFSRMVPNLIDQISCQMLTGKVGGKVRTLTINPNSRLASQKWRAQVLEQLKKIVNAYLDKHKVDTAPAGEPEVFHANNYPMIRGPIVPSYIKKMWTEWPKARSLGAETQEYASLTREEKVLEKFISNLLPVIKECWIEEHNSEGTTTVLHTSVDTGHRLRPGSLPMLQSVVGLLHSFTECWNCIYVHQNRTPLESSWLRGEFLNEMKELLLPHFPIDIPERTQKDNKGSPAGLSVLQTSVLKLNLLVCEALAAFPPEQDGWPEVEAPREDWHKQVVSFLLQNFKLCKGIDLTKKVISVLRKVFFHFPATKKQDKLLAKVQKRFIEAHPLSTEKRLYLGMLKELGNDFHQESPYNACYNTKNVLLKSYYQHLPVFLLQLRGLEKNEEIVCHLAKVMSNRVYRGKLLMTALEEHMEELLRALVKFPQTCHDSLVEMIKTACWRKPVPEKVLELVEHVCRLPQVKKETAHKLIVYLLREYGYLLKENKSKECKAYKAYYIRFLFSVLVGHKHVEVEALDRDNTPEIGGLTRILWSETAEQLEKHKLIVKECKTLHTPFFPAGKYTYGTEAMDTMAEVWTKQILNKYSALSVLTAYGALMHWSQLIAALEFTMGDPGAALHTDDWTMPKTVANELTAEIWQQQVSEKLPIFKANMRPFTKLAFSVLYSMVSVETSEERVVMLEPVMVQAMWDAASSPMKRSLRMLADLCEVALDFVQAQHAERESMKVILVMTKLLSSEELADLLETYPGHVRKLIGDLQTAVKTVTPLVESKQWWLDFLKVPAGLHS